MMTTIQTETELDLTTLKQFVKDVVLPTANNITSSKTFPIDVFRQLHQQGWLQAFIPSQYGGPNASTLDMLCISRELAYASTGIFSSYIVNMLAMTPVLLYGRESLRNKLCEEFTKQFSLWSYCMTESDAGSNIESAKTKAVRVDGGYKITGSKAFITNANYSQQLIVFANLVTNHPGTPTMTCFYIPANSKGVSRGSALKKLGQHDSDTGELFFDEVFVPEENRIGDEGAGLKIAFHALQRSKTMIAGAAVGMSGRAFELTTNYLQNRVIYSKPLLELHVIKNQLAELQTKARASWLLACDSACAWDEGRKTGDKAILQASMAKMFSADTAVQFVNESLELFGGYGYCAEYEIERLYRDAKVLEIYEGPTMIQLALISQQLFGTDKAKSPRLKIAA